VIVEHVTLASGFRPATSVGILVGNVGTIGVDIFFAISGFLITTLLLREWQNRGAISLKAFYIRRILRIMPAASVFILIVAISQLLGVSNLSAKNWTHVLTYTVNFDPDPAWEAGHLWSLSIEEHFYLLWPLVLVALHPRSAGVLAFLWLLCSPIIRLAVLLVHPQDTGTYELWTPLRVDSISAGCLLAVLSFNREFNARARIGRLAAMVLVPMIGVVMIGSVLFGYEVEAYGVALEPSVRAVCIALLVWLSINHAKSLWGRLLETKPFVTVGVLSYSLYLWQQPFLKPDSLPGIGPALLALVVVTTCAAASYRFVELPFQRLKRGVRH
jgi:peptidoglycan/LPS O-acetylase OafA/YrhL